MAYKIAKATITKDNNLYYIFDTIGNLTAKTEEQADQATLAFFNTEINMGFIKEKSIKGLTNWQNESMRLLKIISFNWLDIERGEEIETIYEKFIPLNQL